MSDKKGMRRHGIGDMSMDLFGPPGIESEAVSEGATRKARGGYYTPESLAAMLTSWVVRDTSDRLLDPACGDGRFIAAHVNSVGIEQDPVAAREAMLRAPWSLV
ncbi:MAG TPA: N-6 DNA methylase, partial [Bryobacteraceae bacterium]|nr:N-6 DNA methylase [Bryobacteraceae bacterium]